MEELEDKVEEISQRKEQLQQKEIKNRRQRIKKKLEDQFRRPNIWLVKGPKRESRKKQRKERYQRYNTWKIPRPGQHETSDWKMPVMARTINGREREEKTTPSIRHTSMKF